MSTNPFLAPSSDVDSFDVFTAAPAPRLSRLGASMIDGLCVVVPLAPGLLALVADAKDAVLPLLGLGLLAVFAFAAYQWWLLSTTGQSVGKRALGIRIVMDDGSPVSFWKVVAIRGMAMGAISNIPYIGPIIALVDILMIFGEERRCLHDQLAGTRVVVA